MFNHTEKLVSALTERLCRQAGPKRRVGAERQDQSLGVGRLHSQRHQPLDSEERSVRLAEKRQEIVELLQPLLGFKLLHVPLPSHYYYYFDAASPCSSVLTCAVMICSADCNASAAAASSAIVSSAD